MLFAFGYVCYLHLGMLFSFEYALFAFGYSIFYSGMVFVFGYGYFIQICFFRSSMLFLHLGIVFLFGYGVELYVNCVAFIQSRI